MIISQLLFTNNNMWLQGAFNDLVGLFDRVVLQTNTGKTVGMVYHPCQVAGNPTTAAYERRITGEVSHIGSN